MLYKPNYCCNCGEKTERTHWSLLTSRRFCEICEIEFKGQEMLPKIGAVLMVLLGIFGVGSYLMAGKRTASELKPLKITEIATAGSKNVPESRTNSAETSKKIPVNAVSSPEPVQTTPGSSVLPLAEVAAPPNISPNAPAKASEILAAGNEPAYICGAATKKGKPCTRRVKGGGRCWQHKGQPAMLPPEKLRIS